MELLYFKTMAGNFGDDMNMWFWDAALPGWRDWAPDTTLVGIGTVLKQRFLPAGRRKLVIGSGVGYGAKPDIAAIPDEWDIRCVRGPRTAAALSLPPELAVVDPAVLVTDFPEFADLVRAPKAREQLFVPHHSVARKYDWERICAGTGLTPLNPSGNSREIISRIACAETVIAESMHAAIIADAFRVPWQCVSISRAFNAFKWSDWAESIGAELEITRFFSSLRMAQALAGRLRQPVFLPHGPDGAPGTPKTAGAGAPAEGSDSTPPWLRPVLERLAHGTLRRLVRGRYRLSDGASLDKKKRRMFEILQQVSRDYGGIDAPSLASPP